LDYLKRRRQQSHCAPSHDGHIVLKRKKKPVTPAWELIDHARASRPAKQENVIND
jgi:hypothetical protein